MAVERIVTDDIAAVRERVRIDDVVSAHVTLKNAGGGSLKGLCPFHDERSPSFHVTPSKGLFYCFGCGEGGDAIDFIMKVESLPFAEAVDKLAGRAGVQLRYESGAAVSDPRRVGQRAAAVAVNAAAAAWYAAALPGADHAADWLRSRGFPDDTWDMFGVGYAPRSGLLAHLRTTGFTDDDAVSAGVAGRGDDGRVFERFRDRVIWPIRGPSGDLVGFGARRLSDDDKHGPKYLNTPETVAYRKSHVLYGLHEARRDIARSSQVVVVEGYTDVMACRLAGVTTAVATCGTAFGDGHVKVLRRLLADDSAAQVVFTFDGDAAGQKAALRAYSEDQAFAARTYVAVAGDGLDPCDVRLRDGDDAVRALVETRTPLFEFALRDAINGLDLHTAEGRADGLRKVASIIADIKDPTLRPEYARQVAGWLGVEAHQVQQAVAGHTRRQRSTPARVNESAGSAAGLSDMPALERHAMQAVLQRPALVGEWLNSLDGDSFTDDRLRSVLTAVHSVGPVEGDEHAWTQAVIAAVPHEQRAIVAALTSGGLPSGDDEDLTAGYVTGVLARLLDAAAERTVTSLRVALGDPAVANATRQTALLSDLMAVEQYRRDLRAYWAGTD